MHELANSSWERGEIAIEIRHAPPRITASMTNDHIVENVLISVLAVNGWSAHRVFRLLDRLRAAGLLNLSAVAQLDVEDIATRLASAGYDRGEFMNLLLARRVSSMAIALTPTELDRLKSCLSAGETKEVSGTLRRINGVGPVVLETFWTLQHTD